MVSVIIPAYNAQKTIKACVQSILNQSYKHIEILIIDDGSVDLTLDICRNLEILDKRIRVIHYRNHGVSWARNKGIELSQGKYIMFADSDDTLNDDMIQKLVFHSAGNDMIVCGINAIDVSNGNNKKFLYGCDGDYEIRQYMELLEEGRLNPFFGGVYNKLYLREKIIKNNILFIEGNSFGEDFCFNLKYLWECKKVYIICETLYNYKYNQNNSLTLKNYSELDIDMFWNQEMYVYKLYCETLAKFDMENTFLILLDLWKIFVSKVNKNKKNLLIKKVNIIYKILKKNNLARKVRCIKVDNFREKIWIEILTHYISLFLVCLGIKLKNLKNGG